MIHYMSTKLGRNINNQYTKTLGYTFNCIKIKKGRNSRLNWENLFFWLINQKVIKKFYGCFKYGKNFHFYEKESKHFSLHSLIRKRGIYYNCQKNCFKVYLLNIDQNHAIVSILHKSFLVFLLYTIPFYMHRQIMIQAECTLHIY